MVLSINKTQFIQIKQFWVQKMIFLEEKNYFPKTEFQNLNFGKLKTRKEMNPRMKLMILKNSIW